MTLLSVENLSLDIAGTRILYDVSLTIGAGKTLGLIGESGSGKSMTALSVLGLLPRQSHLQGRIRFDGTDLTQTTKRDMCALRGSQIGMIFQEPMTALNPLRTIGSQVAEVIRLHEPGLDRSKIEDRTRATLARCELPNDRFPLTFYPHQLSGGQRQRVVIAMAIAAGPKLLIADEPTTALDVTTQAQILALLQRLIAEDGMALMLITHDLAIVHDLADDLVILRQGQVMERGPTARVFADMQHPYTKALLEASTHAPDRRAGSMDDAVLRVDGLFVDYALPRKSLFGAKDSFRAVHDVSFMVRRGESLGLVGESGCGKSTLTRAILGLQDVANGTIHLNGTALDGPALSRQSRRQMQVVFQDPYGSFNPRHKVMRLVAEPLFLQEKRPSATERNALVCEALEQVGLSPKDADKYIHEFSGGQRQRIAIARALILRPALILLDEAVSALDVRVRAQILDLLADLQAKLGLSYLFISHDLSVVRSITDRVLVMQAGAIVEEGATPQVFDSPQHSYTKHLIAAAPRLPAEVTHAAF